MDRPISVGDLVQVVRWDCCAGILGEVFRVQIIRQSTPKARCTYCKAEQGSVLAVDSDKYMAPLAWVKRIPPLEELDEVRTEDEVTA
jgi:hypothetical protein